MLLDLVKNLSLVYLPIVSRVWLTLPVEYQDSDSWLDEYQCSEERVLKESKVGSPHSVSLGGLSVDDWQVLTA